ncbi:MAG: T9SS type A sorting domain-containing protein [Phaeodactylibacter sp.]|nr:T9SS type A sorting domain-containing protein [Phaeodactylibacter sp.]
MKNIITTICLFAFFSVGLYAQNTVYLNIEHYLGTEPFVLDQTATNNMGSTFAISRLEYYLSEMTIIHDGGQQTPVEDMYVLVDAASATSIELGTYMIDEVEAIKFYIGVDADNNHSDPASWPSDHPLAPQNPSMHWGWAAGYRFVALEGMGGASLNQLFELHGLGDDNYTKTTITTAAVAYGGEVHINLKADYEQALYDIEVDNGLIIHGDFGEAIEVIQNLAVHVFEGADVSSTTTEAVAEAHFQVYPNPSAGASVQVQLPFDARDNFQVRVTNALGQEVLLQQVAGTQGKLSLPKLTQGMYQLQLLQDGKILAHRSLVITQ